MVIKKAEFIKSSPSLKDCPAGTLPEFAFTGRSNVGKSSLINMLCSTKGLARISSTPGKTQTLNYYLINDQWFIVDLPGYGYASVSMEARKSFEGLMESYLINRSNLNCTFVLVDVRLKPQPSDLDFIHWLGKNNIPMGIVFTKSDKLKQTETTKNINRWTDSLLEAWEELPPIFVTSAKTKKGREELLQYIEEWIRRK